MGPRRIASALALGAAGAWLARHVSSPAVRAWTAPPTPPRRYGPLSARVVGRSGANDPTFVLLHGLGASSDYFGGNYDTLGADARLIAPDLLGFAGSLDEEREEFGLDAHVAAIVGVLDEVGVDGPVVIGAHSMSSAVALELAHAGRADAVVLFGPPVYASAEAALDAIGNWGPLARWYLLDHPVARVACSINCWHRGLSGVVMAALSPALPARVARAASRHTWSSYRGSLDALVVDADWRRLLAGDVPVRMLRGADDSIGELDTVRELAPGASVEVVAGADHHVAITHAARCRTALRHALSTVHGGAPDAGRP